MMFDPTEDNKMEPMTKTANPLMLRSYLEDLYKKKNLGDDQRSKLESSIAESKPGAGLTFLASLGAGLAGQNQLQAVDALNQGAKDKQKELEDFDKKRSGVFDELKRDKEIGKFETDQKDELESSDPNSDKSKMMQALASRLMPNQDFSKYNAKQLGTVMERLETVSKQTMEDARRREDMAFNSKKEATANAFKEKELAAKLAADEYKKENPKSEGMKALDKEFAKDYNEWTSGGKKTAASEIDKLSEVAKSLRDGGVTTGGLTGLFPDRMTSNAVLKARSDVESTVMNSLKAIMGTAFTEKEGARVIKNTWNEADSTENNLARLERTIQDLKNRAMDTDKKATFYGDKGTLSGFTPDASPVTQKVIKSKQYSPSRNKTKIIYDDGTEEIVDGQQ